MANAYGVTLNPNNEFGQNISNFGNQQLKGTQISQIYSKKQ